MASLGVFGAVAALLVAGCGIRPTSVPVDAGAAPSRASCKVPATKADTAVRPAGGVSVTVQLVCTSQLLPVERVIQLPRGDKAPRPEDFARALLSQLHQELSTAEKKAGFTTEVETEVRVSGSVKGDPPGTLRLNREPDGLPSFALAQLVCTFARTPAVDHRRAVVLGGPATTTAGDALGRGELKRYECGTDLRTHPESAQSSGTLLE
ncbi:hypothetical protein [Streptomyces sp. NPDC057702]|uniref:hypothetical protein n=1 Tax=unclassified Streptomyces TaxID=2593676 RepID=UPI0036C9F445